MKVVIGHEVKLEGKGPLSADAVGEHDLVNIETVCGRSIQLASDSIFALVTPGQGQVLLQSSPRFQVVLPDFRRPAVGAALLAGMLLANGTYRGTESLPASIRVSEQRLGTLTLLQSVMQDLAAQLRLVDKTDRPWRIRRTPVPLLGAIDVSSRVLDILFQRFGPAEPGTVAPLVDATSLPREQAQAFAIGLISNMTPIADGFRLIHRSADVVRAIAGFLLDVWAVPVDIHINPAEPETMVHGLRTKNPHHLILRHDRLLAVRSLWFPQLGAPGASKQPYRFHDRIRRLTRVRAPALAIDASERFVLANGFAIDLEFEAPRGALELATMTSLLADVADPDALAKAMVPDMTHLHGVLGA